MSLVTALVPVAVCTDPSANTIEDGSGCKTLFKTVY